MDIPGLPARRAALRLLDAVLRRGETLDVALHAATQGMGGSSDRALARALAAEALRWLVDLDALIDGSTAQPLPPDAKPRSVLRLMLAGWLRLDTPPHAVIATALPLLSGGPRRLAHGVFSALVKRAVTLPMTPTLPQGPADRWGNRGPAIAAALAVPPPLDLTLRDPADTARWAETLGGMSLMPGHIRLPRGEAVERLAGFAEGAWWVQDLAASLPARLLERDAKKREPVFRLKSRENTDSRALCDPFLSHKALGVGHGRRVLDLCAAPGGKTLQLAAAGWQVTALDSSRRRLEHVHANLARCRLDAEVVVGDAFSWAPAAPYDAILIDAPCTATGTCRRHPDVLHRIGPRQIAAMAELQTRLLARAVDWLAPGGRLVYAVCSLEPAEGEDQAARVTLTIDPIHADELAPGLIPTDDGWLRTDPGMLASVGGLDGFFMARWQQAAG